MAGAHPETGQQLLVARVGDRVIGIVATRIAQVMPMTPLWRPPTVPAPLRGFVPIAGITLPVLSARALLAAGTETAPSVYAHILRLTRIGAPDGLAAGLLVDRALGFTTPAALGAIDEGQSLGGCATALFHFQGEMAHLIDPDRLLGRAERDVLAALTAEAAARAAEWQDAAA